MNETTDVVQVNYWKELRKELNKTIGKATGLILLTHNSIEFTDVIDFLNKIRRDEQLTVLYISMINSYKHIKRSMEGKELVSKKLFVVDCVSGFLIEIQDEVECKYRKPPESLDEMKEMIEKNIKWANPNMIVVDSLSQFINFTMPTDSDIHKFYGFLKNLKEDAIGLVNDTVILLYDDKTGAMKKLPTLFTDLILKLEVIREKIEWKD